MAEAEDWPTLTRTLAYCLRMYTINKYNTHLKRINDYKFVKILCATREDFMSVMFVICLWYLA